LKNGRIGVDEKINERLIILSFFYVLIDIVVEG